MYIIIINFMALLLCPISFFLACMLIVCSRPFCRSSYGVLSITISLFAHLGMRERSHHIHFCICALGELISGIFSIFLSRSRKVHFTSSTAVRVLVSSHMLTLSLPHRPVSQLSVIHQFLCTWFAIVATFR